MQRNPDPYKGMSIGAGILFIATLPALLAVVLANMDAQPRQQTNLMPIGAFAQLPIVPGDEIFANTCAVCHGPQGDGVPKLGKPVRNSAFVQASTDQELFNLIANGREATDPLNTSRMPMPARGAKSLSDDDITRVIAHVRDLQDLSQPHASVEAWIAPPPTEDELALADLPGHDLFVSACSSCHGPNGEGMEGLGKPFTTSAFVQNSTDKELATMIKMGRPIWDAANTTGIDMPPKGGNPALSDDELAEIIQFIRSVGEMSPTQP